MFFKMVVVINRLFLSYRTERSAVKHLGSIHVSVTEILRFALDDKRNKCNNQPQNGGARKEMECR